MMNNAKWISHPGDGESTPLVPVFLRRFCVKEGLCSATLHITSHGLYTTEINGEAACEDKFTPGFTSYYHRIQVQSYDVMKNLCLGENIWQTTVGDGWWRWKNNFGYTLSLCASLELKYENGNTEYINTDEDFLVSCGAIISSDMQKGEVYDARITPCEWLSATISNDHTDAEMIKAEGVPVREKERFSGKLFKDSAGNLVADFGQNIAGYVKMTLHNTTPGQIIHIKHGEGLDKNGAFSTANCDGGMKEFQEITYICRGGDTEEYAPHFSCFGFRYALIEGIEDGELCAIALYSDMEEVGDFKCSNPLINKLVENSRWSQKGNFLDVPVDCPTRERNAWTGDAQIYVNTAAYFMDVESFFEKWLADQRIEQYSSGKVGITFPSTSSVHNPTELEKIKKTNPAMALAGPDGDGHIGEDSVGWGDSAVWIPYQLYLMYGNKRILEDHYECARRWVDFSLSCMKEKNPLHSDKPWYKEGEGDLIYDTRFHYGEWNEPLPPAPEVIELFMKGGTAADYVTHMAKYGKPEVATAYTKRSCDNLSHMAKILGKGEDAEKYARIAKKLKYAYSRYLISDEGVIQKGHQAAYVRALALDMVEENKKALVISELRKEIVNASYHLNTGFLSTVYLLPTLCDNGLKEEAFRILEQTETPSWLSPILMGATTMPENWDGFDRFRDSFNHYSLGAVCQFLFAYIGGIRPRFDKPGFEEFDLIPVFGGSLTYAKTEYKTKFGLIKSSWEIKDEVFIYSCSVPDGTKAHLTMPSGKNILLLGGDYLFEERLTDDGK